MKAIGEFKTYLTYKTDDGNYILCKILKEYGHDSHAGKQFRKDLVSLLSHNTTKKKLINKIIVCVGYKIG